MNIAAKYLLQAIGQPVPAFMEEVSPIVSPNVQVSSIITFAKCPWATIEPAIRTLF